MTYFTSIWVWIFKKKASYGFYGTVVYTWQGGPGGHDCFICASRVKYVFTPKPSAWL